MKLPSIKNLNISGKRILLRTNYDVPLKKDGVANDSRIIESLETINFLLQKKLKIVIISHLGRPEGKVIPGLSLLPVVKHLAKFLSREVPLVEGFEQMEKYKDREIVLLENLRFNRGEETNNKKFVQQLVSLADFYVNDAFAVSHRSHASVVGVPLFLPTAFGLDFLEEVKILLKVKKSPERPVVVILGGVKKSKARAVRKLVKWADYILIGGQMIKYAGLSKMINGYKKILGSLTRSGEDITTETIEEFKKVIVQAKTIILAGPMGAYEEKEFERGTKEIMKAIVASGAYSVVGGGDTEAALTKFGLVDKINYISSGGGAMLAFLANDTLPGIEVINDKNRKVNDD